jgi:hypothetical protein
MILLQVAKEILLSHYQAFSTPAPIWKYQATKPATTEDTASMIQRSQLIYGPRCVRSNALEEALTFPDFAWPHGIRNS